VNCHRFNMYVFDYCEDNLSPALKEQMDKHLRECSCCSSQVKLTYLENEVLRDKSDLPILADDFTARVMQHIIGAEQVLPFDSKASKKPGNIKARGLTWAAAVGLIVLLAIFAPQVLPYHQSTRIADNPPVGSEQHMENSAADKMQIQSQTKYENEPSNDYKSAQPLPDAAEKQNSIQIADVDLKSVAPSEELPNDDQPVTISMSAAVDTQLYDVSSTETESTASADIMYFKTSDDIQAPSRWGSINARSGMANGYTSIPVPHQIPDNFTLINTVNSYSTEGSAVEYHYTDKTNRSLIITLQKNDQEPVMRYHEPGSAEILRGSADNTSKKDLEITYQVNFNNQAYQVTLKGSLSAEDLVNLAEVITFTDSSTSSPSR
jgi:hypothetical protein